MIVIGFLLMCLLGFIALALDLGLAALVWRSYKNRGARSGYTIFLTGVAVATTAAPSGLLLCVHLNGRQGGRLLWAWLLESPWLALRGTWVVAFAITACVMLTWRRRDAALRRTGAF
ncbi:MAG: hypothetical protein ACI8X5_002129 [Planctomycetota bacterium]|jgi:hypothetical protein